MAEFTENSPVPAGLAILFEAAEYAFAIMPWNRFGPIVLPAEPGERTDLLVRHWHGEPGNLLFVPRGRPAKHVHVEAVQLAILCPAADGRTSWMAADLDAADGHGARGLRRPCDAGRAILAAAKRLGLADGAWVARSRGGVGRHVVLCLPARVSLVVAGLAWTEILTTATKHNPDAFLTPGGKPAQVEPGAIELIPRTALRPRLGWPILAPAAARTIVQGGVADPLNWAALSERIRQTLAARERPQPRRRRWARSGRTCSRTPGDRISQRSRAFLDGAVSEGGRNAAAFAAACDLLGHGHDERDALSLILDGARRCGLPEPEAQAAVRSAAAAVRRRGASR